MTILPHSYDVNADIRHGLESVGSLGQRGELWVLNGRSQVFGEDAPLDTDLGTASEDSCECCSDR